MFIKSLQFIPEPLQLLRIIAPVFTHLYPELKIDLTFNKSFNIFPGGHPQPFYGFAVMPQDNSLLRFPGHVYCCSNVGNIFLLLVLINGNFNRIRNLLFVIQQYFLADDLGNEKPH